MKAPKFDINAWYIDKTITEARAGNVDAAEEAMSLFRSAVDARNIDGAAAEYRKLAEYVAECFYNFESGKSNGIDDALHIDPKRGVGQPKGNRKVSQDSYAAFLVILSKQLGSGTEAKKKVLDLESDAAGKSPVSKRTLDQIYADYKPLRVANREMLLVMLSPAHRKLLGRTLR